MEDAFHGMVTYGADTGEVLWQEETDIKTDVGLAAAGGFAQPVISPDGYVWSSEQKYSSLDRFDLESGERWEIEGDVSLPRKFLHPIVTESFVYTIGHVDGEIAIMVFDRKLKRHRDPIPIGEHGLPHSAILAHGKLLIPFPEGIEAYVHSK
jgi:hypothetical protein